MPIIYTSAMELFTSTQNEKAPLAFRMRPRNIDEFIGQDHIAGPGRLLRRIIQADRMSSIIFYGPPGTGKTTLARVIANTTSSSFITMNAVLDGVKNLRDAIAEAQSHRDLYDRRTILFVDEVHRWNKSQQDALLPWVENGTVILIGATTENPYFEVNKALVSRSRIFQLKPLTEENLHAVALQAVKDSMRGYGRWKVEFDAGALEHLIHTANGDARSLLNAVELAVETSAANFPPEPESLIIVSVEAAEESIQKKALLYDKEGDYHYDTISAFIKSIRGSDPDAALYWLATMIRAGEEPRYMFRRMLISASEDIGLADPQALGVVESAAAAFDRVGLPEGRLHLTQAALYLATAPKSNTTLAVFDALGAVEKEFAKEVPNHLKDGGRDKEGFGHGDGYMYPHAYKDHWVAQQYLPTGLQGRVFYEPSDQGFEAGIKERITRRRELQLATVTEDRTEEVLTFSKPNKGSEQWLNRANRETSGTLAAIRDMLFDLIDGGRPAADPHVTGERKQKTGASGTSGGKRGKHSGIARHECILVLEPAASVLLWEAVRKTPEGSVYYLPASTKAAEISRHWAGSLPEEKRPIEIDIDGSMSPSKHIIEGNIQKNIPHDLKFEKIITRDLLTRCSDRKGFFTGASMLLAEGGSIHLCQLIPSETQKLSRLEELDFLYADEPELYSALTSIENKIYSNPENPLVNWSSTDIEAAAEAAGFEIDSEIRIVTENRPVQGRDIETWFNTEGKGYGKYLPEILDQDDFERLKKLVRGGLENKIVRWNLTFLMLKGLKTKVQ